MPTFEYVKFFFLEFKAKATKFLYYFKFDTANKA